MKPFICKSPNLPTIFQFIFICLIFSFSSVHLATAKVLIQVVREGDVKTLNSIFDKGADVSNIEGRWATVLETAIDYGHVEVVRTLIERGLVDINVTNSGDYTGLQKALRLGKPDIAKLFIDRGADINPKNKSGTPLYYAIDRGYTDIALLLIEKGATFNNTVTLFLASSNGNIDVVRELINKSVNVQAEDQFGNTALLKAAEQEHTKVVELLIDKGADVNARDEKNSTPLIKISSVSRSVDTNYSSSIVKLLLKNGADVNAKTTGA